MFAMKFSRSYLNIARQMPSLPYRIEHLNNVTVRVRRADQRRGGFAEST